MNDAELCDRYAALYPGAVTDVLDECGYGLRALPSAIEPLTLDTSMAGIAYPVHGYPDDDCDFDANIRRFLRMLGDAPAESVGLVDPPGLLADDRREFDLVVHFLRQRRVPRNRVARADYRRGVLREEDRVVRSFLPALLDVLDVVEPDADDFLWLGDRRLERDLGAVVAARARLGRVVDDELEFLPPLRGREQRPGLAGDVDAQCRACLPDVDDRILLEHADGGAILLTESD
jgi:hypothetical protein